ncbi:MAG: hypothetical protein CMJ84_07320 [Planctomycetes bacterium]|nr:hypothetical protein [Planctomycetota bacterium]MDP6409151.1 hypothetical protein [Planctomycetota bacterium]
MSTGEELHWLVPSSGGDLDLFGSSVAIGGSRIVVGSPEFGGLYGTGGPGAAYVFSLVTGMEVLELAASDAADSDFFGCGVDIGAGRIAVANAWESGAPSGAIYVFAALTGNQHHLLTDDASPSRLGSYTALGGGLVFGLGEDSLGESAVYAFDVESGQERFTLTHGMSLLSADGDRLVGGSPFDDTHGDSAGLARMFFIETGDDCESSVPIAGQGAFPFDLTGATTGPEGQNEALCLFGSDGLEFDVWREWTADATGTTTVTTCATAAFDTKLAVYPGPGCPTDGTALACDDDVSGCGVASSISWPTSAGTTYMLQIGTFPGAAPGSGSISVSTILECLLVDGGPGVPFCCGSGCPCGNDDVDAGCAHSGGSGANLVSAGSASAGADDLEMHASGMLLGQPVQLFSAQVALDGGGGVPFLDGLRCTGVELIRHEIQVADATGAASWVGGLLSGAGVVPGEVRHFQVFYRDVASACGAGANTTNATSVSVAP